MAKTLKLNESFAVENKAKEFSFKEFDNKNGKVLIPKIEAIHAGTTANYRTYTDNYLQGNIENHSGVYSWTYPYPKPVLKNHDTWEEPLGRVTSAQFVTDSLTGRSANIVMPTITDPEAIEKILDGRYLTVSIGGHTNEAACSICGQDIINDGWCDHERGEKYEVNGKMVTCTWIIGEIWFHEISFVNIPADEHAQVVASGNVIPMECYSFDGKEILDLQTNQTMTLKQAKEEGIHLSELKGGNKQVKKLEELQVELEKATNQIAKLEEDQQTLQSKLEEAEGKVSEANTQIEELTTEKKTLEEKVETNEAAAEEKIETLGAEKQELMEKNAELAKEIHKNLAERVVDTKRFFGKPGCEDRETAVAEHLERSEQSLKDSLSDLLQETHVFKPNTIENPGIPNTPDKQNTQASNNEGETKISVEDVFYGLLNKSKKM